MFGITDTLGGHLEYTTNEWNTSGYYLKVREFLKNFGIKNFIDIGSCSGVVSDILLEDIPTLKRSILVEAMPENFQFISDRIDSDDRRLVINKAIFYNKERINLGRVRNNVGGWSYQSSDDSVSIETSSIEKIIEDYSYFIGDSIDFIKIDVEGAEYNIIENSTALKNVPLLEIEFHPNEEYGMNYLDGKKFLNDSWGPFIDKFLPNHSLVFGGKNESVIWPNGESVIYDGSAFFVLKDLIK